MPTSSLLKTRLHGPDARILRVGGFVVIALMGLGNAAGAQRARVSDVQIVPPNVSLRVGERQQLQAAAYDAEGNPVDARFEWSSSDAGVVRIDESGMALGVSAGLAIVTVRTGSGAQARSAQAPAQVAAAAPNPTNAPRTPLVESQRSVSGGAPPPAPDPTTLRYANGSWRFRTEEDFQRVVTDSTGTHATDQSVAAVVTVTVAGPGDTLDVFMAVDSLNVSGNANALDSIRAGRGRIFRARQTRRGLRLGVAVSDSSNRYFSARAGFLPALPTVAVTPGATWIDSTTNRTPWAGGTMVARTHSDNRVVGWETRDKVRVVHIVRDTRRTVDASGTWQGRPIELHGTAVATTNWYATADGAYAGKAYLFDYSGTMSVSNGGAVLQRFHTTTRESETPLP